ncbi:hypothetical protein Sjap_001545 [Stephania japonica]|uniref:Uncharacterized protein n=1 Tax=Stephania japonica TaxID=461633 RepID=A0AAP0KMQ2_9MAGN
MCSRPLEAVHNLQKLMKPNIPTSTLAESSIEIHHNRFFGCKECTNPDQMSLKWREEMKIIIFLFFVGGKNFFRC